MISLSNNQNNFAIDEEIFEQKAQKITQQIVEGGLLKKSPLAQYDFIKNEVNIDIMLCDNEQIQQVNKDYRSKDKPTDVITFALFADDENRMILGEEIHLGEIIISLEKIQEQANEHNKSFDDELYFILAHGILHLFGFTHENDDKLEFMIKIQEQLIV